MKSILLSTILFLVPLATCHFKLEHPPSRAGDDDEKQATFPCGGFDTPSKERTQFPLTGGSVQLELGHDRSLVQVLLALGNDPGDSFNLVWKPTVQEEGPGEFCFPDLVPFLFLSFFLSLLLTIWQKMNGRLTHLVQNVPASLNLKDGQNATIQVVTDSHDGKGLYNVCLYSHPDPPPHKNKPNSHKSHLKNKPQTLIQPPLSSAPT